MYILFEHHRDASRQVIATDMLLTSHFPGKPGIAFKSATENALFTLFTGKSGLFKEPLPATRTYDPKTFVWSYFGTVGQSVYDAIKNSPLAAIGIKFQRIENLAEQAASGYISAPSKSEAFDPNNFFYEAPAATPTGPSIEQITSELEAMFGFALASSDADTVKKQYRRLALQYHPDRNGGDSTKMSHLNWLWQSYQKGSVV